MIVLSVEVSRGVFGRLQFLHRLGNLLIRDRGVRTPCFIFNYLPLFIKGAREHSSTLSELLGLSYFEESLMKTRISPLVVIRYVAQLHVKSISRPETVSEMHILFLNRIVLTACVDAFLLDSIRNLHVVNDIFCRILLRVSLTYVCQLSFTGGVVQLDARIPFFIELLNVPLRGYSHMS